jgi:glycosyltransferase involved in cell wall biosynthesis
MNGSTLVSICIPAHNDAAVVADAIRSARAQSYAPLEIIVLDNASADDTGDVVQRAAGNDARIRYVRHPRDIGMAGNFSACIAAARGALVHILCADDALEPGAVQALAQALAQHPQAVLAACGRKLCDANLQPLRVAKARARLEEVAGAGLMRECFARGNRIGEPSAVMFRREAGRRGFSAEYSQLVDLEMWFHLLSSGTAVLLPDALCRVRQHAGQLTAANIRSARLLEDKQRFFRQFAPRIAPMLSTLDRLAWDARMASSVARVRRAGATGAAGLPAEVFHPALLRTLLLPVVAAGWRLRGR